MGTKSWAQSVLVANWVHMVIVDWVEKTPKMDRRHHSNPALEAPRRRTAGLRPALKSGRRSSGARARWPRLGRRSSRACARWPESGEAEPRGACAAAWAAGPSLGGGARRGRPHGKGEVRWPPPPPAPQFVARRKMADLEEQLSDEEKVGAAARRSRAAGSEGRGARAGVSPGRAPVVGRTPPLPERGSARPPSEARPLRSL